MVSRSRLVSSWSYTQRALVPDPKVFDEVYSEQVETDYLNFGRYHSQRLDCPSTPGVSTCVSCFRHFSHVDKPNSDRNIERYLRSYEGFWGLSSLGGTVFLAGEQRVDRGIKLLAAFEEVQFEDENVAQQYYPKLRDQRPSSGSRTTCV